MSLFKLPQTNGAACLDGTPPAYWLVQGTETTKYYINFEGGGWCTSLDDCASRAGSRKGSSNNLPDPFNLVQLMGAWGTWYFGNTTDVNPLMHNWTMIQVLYCDGASWAGSNSSATVHKNKTLHFKGKNNLDALMADLLTKQAMDQATEVVISGGSAGALAVYLHADAIRKVLPKSAKVVAMPDDGFFMDNDQSRAHGWVSKQRWTYEAQNGSAGVPAECLGRYRKDEQWNCFMAQAVAPGIRTPLFALQPMYDAYQIGAELGTSDPAAVNAYGANLTATLKATVLANPQNGAYLDGCEHHGGGWPAMFAQAADKSWASPIKAFSQWYAGVGDPAAATTRRYWQMPSTGMLPNGRLASDFPCQACCPCKPNRTSSNFNQGCSK